MKAILEPLTVAGIAFFMGLVGFGLVDWWSNDFDLLRWDEPGWTAYTGGVSVVTWLLLYRMCRNLHWLVLPVMGVFSPLIGAVLFTIPFFLAPWVVIWTCALVVFPTGVVTGFLISAATLPFRPRGVRQGNVEA
jgi:hypothetical protein